jgi:hypothetical protein
MKKPLFENKFIYNFTIYKSVYKVTKQCLSERYDLLHSCSIDGSTSSTVGRHLRRYRLLSNKFSCLTLVKNRRLSACSNFSCIKKVNAKLKSRPEGVVEEQDITYSSCRNAIDRVVVRHFKMHCKVSLIRVLLFLL